MRQRPATPPVPVTPAKPPPKDNHDRLRVLEETVQQLDTAALDALKLRLEALETKVNDSISEADDIAALKTAVAELGGLLSSLSTEVGRTFTRTNEDIARIDLELKALNKK